MGSRNDEAHSTSKAIQTVGREHTMKFPSLAAAYIFQTNKKAGINPAS
jgi:hypothetical protein